MTARLAFLAFTLAAVPAAAADPPAHRQKGDAALAARTVFVKHCAECHSETGKRGRLNVTSHKSLVGTAGPVWFASPERKDPRSQVVEFLRDGSMPPGGRPRPTDDEIAAVEKWVNFESPDFPARLDDEGVLAAVAEDYATVTKDKASVRYLSLAHVADSDPKKVAAAEDALVSALNDVMLHEVPPAKLIGTVLTPLSSTAGTVYRLNLRKLVWDANGLFVRYKAGRPQADEFPLVPFDLIQLENPYPPPVALERSLADKIAGVLAEMNPHRTADKKPLAQLRAVPFVRADWLAKALWRDGKATPLAEDLVALAELDKTPNDKPPGPKVERDLEKPGPFRRGETGPGESVWAWYLPQVPAKNPAVMLIPTHNLGDKPLPKTGGDFVLTLTAKSEKPAFLTVVEVWPGERAAVLKLTQGAKLDGDEKKEVVVAMNEKGKMSVSPHPDAGSTVFYLLFASTEEPKGPPVVVGSKHAEFSRILRVLPSEADAESGGASLPAVRAVLPVSIKKEE